MSSLHSSIDKELLSLIEKIDTHTDFETKLISLRRLIEISNLDNHKAAMCAPKYNLLPKIKILLEQEQNFECRQRAIHILWFLSRNYFAKECICSKELELLPILFQMFKSNYDLYPNIHKCLSNCSMSSKTHDYLLSPEFEYLDICKTLYVSNPENTLAIQSYFCACSDIKEERSKILSKVNIIDFVAQELLTSYPNPYQWPDRFRGPQYWCVNFLTSISAFRSCREVIFSLKSLNNILCYFIELAKSREIESLKAFIFLSNITGHLYKLRDNYEMFPDLLSDFNGLNLSVLVSYLVKGMVTTMFYADHTMSEFQLHSYEGFAYGILKLRDFSTALFSLSLISKSMREKMLKEKPFFRCIFEIVDMFVESKEECCRLYQITYEYGGGGKDDFHTINSILSLLLQLCYDYESKEERLSHLQLSNFPLQEKIRNILNQNQNGRYVPENTIALSKLLISLL